VGDSRGIPGYVAGMYRQRFPEIFPLPPAKFHFHLY